MNKLAIGLFFFGGALAIFAGAASGVFSDAGPENRLQAPTVVAGPSSVVKNIDGGSWKTKSYDGAGEKTCIQNTVPGEAIGTTCIPTAEVFSGGRDLLVLPGARQREGTDPLLEWGHIWIHGLAKPDVASVSIAFVDCSTESVDVADDGMFLYVTPTVKIRKKVIPYKVLAIGTSGDILDSQPIDVGVPKKAEEAGLKPPKPKNCTQ